MRIIRSAYGKYRFQLYFRVLSSCARRSLQKGRGVKDKQKADGVGRLQLQWLDTFDRLARLGNQPAVARELGTTQATVSRQVTALEEWLGRKLVLAGSPVCLTEDGERFVPIAVEVLARLQGFQPDLSRAMPAPPKPSGATIQIP
jgi:hypothetical protein